MKSFSIIAASLALASAGDDYLTCESSMDCKNAETIATLNEWYGDQDNFQEITEETAVCVFMDGTSDGYPYNMAVCGGISWCGIEVTGDSSYTMSCEEDSSARMAVSLSAALFALFYLL